MTDAALKGQVDRVTPYRVTGWAFDPDPASAPVIVVVTNNGEVLDRVTADGFRDDICAAGYGDGHCGFDVWLPARLSPASRNVLRVFRESDGQDLQNSPVVLESSEAFGPAGQARLSELLAAPMDATELRRHIEFFAQLLDGLKQRAADDASAAEPRVRSARRGDTMPGKAGTARPKPRALVIDKELPDTTRDAGSVAIVSHIRSLQRLGYEVSLIPGDLDGARSEQARALESEGIVLYLRPQVSSVEELLRRQRDAFDVVYFHRFANAARYAPLVHAFQPTAFSIYCVADLHHLRLERQAAFEGNRALMDEAQLTRLRELRAAWQASAVITHSDVEAAILEAALPDARVAVVPWAVRTNAIVRPFEQRRDLAFVGGFLHAPNRAAADRLIHEIMPRIWRSHPNIRCFLIGSHMPEDLTQLDVGGVEVVGHVPDLFVALNRVRLTVAPLVFGAGAKGKVLESFAHGVPCVMSEMAAEGLRLPADLRACVADDDEALAQAMIRLHEDEALNAQCAASGLGFVETAWSEAPVDDAFRRLLGLRATHDLETGWRAEPSD